MIYSSIDIECDRLKLVFMGHFLPLYPLPLKTKKIRILKKLKKLQVISSFYACAPKPIIIWGMLPGIQSETDIISLSSCKFLPFYPPNNPENQNFENMKKAPGDVINLHICPKNHNHMMYASWDMECDRHNFFVNFVYFLPFYPTVDPKN